LEFAFSATWKRGEWGGRKGAEEGREGREGRREGISRRGRSVEVEKWEVKKPATH